MYKHCNTEESARRQRQLEESLLELIEDTPYHAITISQICDQVGISRKSFYRYFDSKDGCLFALLDHTIMDSTGYYMPEGSLDFTSVDFCVRNCEYWQKQTPLLDALEKNGLSLHLLQRMVRYILVEEPAYAHYMGIPQDDVIEHIVYHVGGLMGLILTWHHNGYQKTAAEMGRILHRLTQQKQGE